MGRAFTAGRLPSYQWLGKHAVVWGDAGYDQRRTRYLAANDGLISCRFYLMSQPIPSVARWNEAYRFHMGYARQLNRWCYGAEAAYEMALIIATSIHASQQQSVCRPQSGRIPSAQHALQPRRDAFGSAYSQEQSIAFIGAITLPSDARPRHALLSICRCIEKKPISQATP